MNYQDIPIINYDLKIKILLKTFNIIKRNVNHNDIRDETYTVFSDESDTRIRLLVESSEYENVLEKIKQDFVKLEWYEECQEIVDCKEKIKVINETNNRANSTSTKCELSETITSD